MRKKLMAFDLDGTLLFDGGIDPDNIQAIHEWQAAGHLAVLSTGKSISATRNALANFDLHFDHHVLYTGAVVTDAQMQIEYSSTIPTDVVLRTLDLLADLDTQFNVYATTLDTPDALLHEAVVDHRTSVLVNPVKVALADIPQHTYVGVPIWIPNNEQALQQAFDQIRATFPEVDCHRNQNFLDIVPKSATKASGLKALVATLKEEFDTYSIGDSWNDIDMHRWATTSASFTYSPDEVKAESTTVVSTAAEFIRSVL